jgi:predicted metal-dependent hydrolase
MSRDVDFNDPSSWNDEDKEWLRQRIDRVPAQHREHLDVNPVSAPANEAENVELDRLRAFLMANFPDEMATSDQSPVGVAIRLLTDDYEGVTETTDDASVDDTYDSWKVNELRDEVTTRNNSGAAITPASDKKADLVSALRADDASKL